MPPPALALNPPTTVLTVALELIVKVAVLYTVTGAVTVPFTMKLPPMTTAPVETMLPPVFTLKVDPVKAVIPPEPTVSVLFVSTKLPLP